MYATRITHFRICTDGIAKLLNETPTTEGAAPVSNRMVIAFDGDQAVITFDGDVQVALPNAIPVPSSHEWSDPQLAYSLERAAELTMISKNKLFDYIADGKLPTRRNGRNHIIRRADLEAFIDSLPTTSEGE